MSGPITGEVHRYASQLRAAGVDGSAYWALTVVASGAYDHNRIGKAPLDLVRSVIGRGTRTATRALETLRDCGVIEVVRPGRGGRGKQVALYRIARIDEWLAARAADDPADVHPADVHPSAWVDTQVSTQTGADTTLGGHPDVHPSGPATSENVHPNPVSVDIPATLGRHPDVYLYGDPRLTDEGATRDSPDNAWFAPPPPELAAPAAPPETRPRSDRPARAGATPAAPAAAPNTERAARPAPARARPPVPAESWCRTPGCRAPDACGACGRARAAGAPPPDPAPDPGEQARRRAADTARQESITRQRQRALAAATCPLGCVDGYLGTAVCDHTSRRAYATMAGWQTCREVLARTAARRGHRPDPPTRRRRRVA